MRSRPAIRTSGLAKRYDERTVLAGLDLEVPAGTVFALLGPNGAGKTTTVHILSTLISADDGTAEVLGHDVVGDPDGVRAVIGLTGQFSAVDGLLTGRENLRLMTDLRHLGRREGPRRVDELLEQFDLVDAADRPLATYSGGMRRRLDLAMTLVGDPELIFLDEPTAGLDPRSRRMMWDTIRSLVGGGVTIFLTTQYLDEADALADRIALLDEGRIVAEGTAAELKRLVPGGHVRLEFTDQHSLAAVVPRFDDVAMDDTGLALHIPSDGSIRSLREIISNIDDSTVSTVSIHTSDLDDVFLALTGSRTTSEEEVSQ